MSGGRWWMSGRRGLRCVVCARFLLTERMHNLYTQHTRWRAVDADMRNHNSATFLPRNAMLARYTLWPRVCLSASVRLSVSVTSRSFTKSRHCLREQDLYLRSLSRAAQFAALLWFISSRPMQRSSSRINRHLTVYVLALMARDAFSLHLALSVRLLTILFSATIDNAFTCTTGLYRVAKNAKKAERLGSMMWLKRAGYFTR